MFGEGDEIECWRAACRRSSHGQYTIDSLQRFTSIELINDAIIYPSVPVARRNGIYTQRMSLTEHHSSPSTVQFTYSLQPRSSPSLPSVTSIVDFVTSLVQSALILVLAQWSTTHFHTNRIIGPILRYLRYLLPYNDIRILRPVDGQWEITPLGIMGIVCLAFFLLQ